MDGSGTVKSSDPQPSSDETVTTAIVDTPLVATDISPPEVSPCSFMNSTQHEWGWPAFPRIFLDICSGAGYPLSKAMMDCNCACFPVDILLSPTMDILNNSFYEPLLRVCASGIVAYGSGAPNCGEYSRLKLRGNGPPALRTPEHLQGVPHLSPAQLLKVQSSFELMVRVVTCLELIYSAGGHVHLEQPTNSMAWMEKDVLRFLKFCAPYLVNFAACAYGANWQKSWLLACSYSSMTSLGTKCDHDRNLHEVFAGQSADGSFRSRKTAEYPQAMCSAIATLISPLCQSTATLLDISTATTLIPKKGLTDFPVSYEDGGGLFSQPDWSRPHRQEANMFQHLRKSWIDRILATKLHHKFLQFLQTDDSSPPFSEDDIQPFRDILSEFLAAHGRTVSWDIREDQPMHLSVLQQLSSYMQDADTTLFASLQEGVSTGIDKDIPPSTCFPVASNSMENATPLSVHLTNWRSAEDDLDTTRSLVQQELDKGWVYKYPGTLADAQMEFGDKLSVGRLGLALSDARPPRLVVDSSVCGLNSQVEIPERTTLPSALDVLRVYPLRNLDDSLVGFSLDVKSAHKLVVLRKSERGLVGFSLDGAIYFYKVCPFGASFSAYHWTRLGSFILRWFHNLLWLQHAGLLYVDDFFFIFPRSVAVVMATMLCIASQVVRLPISWGKCEFGTKLKWIGWNFYVFAGYLALPEDKLHKLSEQLKELRRSDRCSKKSLEKAVGLLNWLTQVFILMRTWLPYLYRDLFSIPASHYSIDPGSWQSIMECLDDDLIFKSQPRGSGIPVGSKLLAVRHQPVQCKKDLSTLYLSERRIWVRLRDFQSSKRKLSQDTQRVINMYLDWISSTSVVKSLFPRQLWQGECAADACAHGNICQIGGFVRFPNHTTVWFSCRFEYSDFAALNIPVTSEMQKFIACFETLAQMAIMLIFSRNSPGFRFPLRIPSLTDNSGTESGGNKLFSTTFPMNLFLEKLTVLCTISGMELDLSHIAGERNDEADALSRWNFTSEPPFGHQLCNRMDISLQDLWLPIRTVSVHPADTYLLWKIP